MSVFVASTCYEAPISINHKTATIAGSWSAAYPSEDLLRMSIQKWKQQYNSGVCDVTLEWSVRKSMKHYLILRFNNNDFEPFIKTAWFADHVQSVLQQDPFIVAINAAMVQQLQPGAVLIAAAAGRAGRDGASQSD